MPSTRLVIARMLIAVVLTIAMPAQWEAFCVGWQSPQEAMACCHRASYDEGPSAAVGCCAPQEASRHAQSPVTTVVEVPLIVQ